MTLFQFSISKQLLALQGKEQELKAYNSTYKYFLNPTNQENIKNSKE